MDIIIYILVSIILGLVIFINIKKHSLNVFNIFLFAISFSYIFVPTLVFIFGEKYQTKYPLIGNICNSSPSERFKVLLYVTIFILCFSLFYTLIKNNTKLRINFNNGKTNELIYRKCKKYLIVFLCVGLLGFLCTVNGFGGIEYFFKYSGSYRGEGSFEFKGDMLDYAIIFSRALLGCMYPLILMYELKNKKYMKLLTIIVIFFSIIYLIFNAGKLQIIIFFTPIIMYIVDKFTNRKNKTIIYFLIGLCILIIVPQLDNLFFYFTYGVPLSSFMTEWSVLDKLMSLINTFTYPFSNLLVVDKMNNFYGMRFGMDYLLPFINIVPNRLLQSMGLAKLQTLYGLTTNYYISNIVGFMENGGMPNDMITVAMRQFTFIGVAICGSIVGVLVKYLDTTFNRLKSLGGKFRHLLYTNCMVMVVLLLIEPYSALMAYFPILASLLLTKSILSITRVENTNFNTRHNLIEREQSKYNLNNTKKNYANEYFI